MKKIYFLLIPFIIFITSCVPVKYYYEKPYIRLEIKSYKKKKKQTLSKVYLKVLILKSKKIYIESKTSILVKNFDIKPEKRYIIKLKNNDIYINNLYTGVNKLYFTTKSNEFKINGKKYRGSIIIKQNKNTLYVINKVNLEEYLYGVLPSEVSPKWDEEVLKAQAVAARTFALYNKLNTKNDDYDMDASVTYQVYSGKERECEKTKDAIDRTKNYVITYKGKLIQAFFHANSGGKTASSEEVWGGKIPYLKSINDPFSINGKHYKWEYCISIKQLESILKTKGIDGEIYDIKILERSESNRIKLLKIYLDSGSIILKGKDFRTYVGVDKLKSTNFNINFKNDKICFKGFGWGHGVGMSQEGAKKMAEEGYSYKDILKFYYRGTEIKKFLLK